MSKPREFYISRGSAYLVKTSSDQIHVREVMPAEVDEDLEAASKHWVDTRFKTTAALPANAGFKAGAEWQKKDLLKDVPPIVKNKIEAIGVAAYCKELESARDANYITGLAWMDKFKSLEKQQAKAREETIRDVLAWLDSSNDRANQFEVAELIKSKFLPKESK